MLSGGIFDLDGVIVDSHPLHRRAWRAFLASVGKEVSESELDVILEGRRRRDVLIHFLGELSDSEIREYGKRKDDFFRQVCVLLQPVAGTVEFIKKLATAELRLAVATSASRQRAQWTLQKFRIVDYFEVIVTGDDVAESKPDPAIYRLAAQRLSISPGRLFALEDSVCGVRSATLAGVRCLGIGRGADVLPLMGAGADCVLPSLVNLSLKDLEKVFAAHGDPSRSGDNESTRANSVNA